MLLSHPGLVLKDKVILANDLSVTDAAALLEVTRPTLSNVLNGKAHISPNMSIRISKVFGGSARFWLYLQSDYNLQLVRIKMKKLKLKAYSIKIR
jgi:addiction module HigA family antidote